VVPCRRRVLLAPRGAGATRPHVRHRRRRAWRTHSRHPVRRDLAAIFRRRPTRHWPEIRLSDKPYTVVGVAPAWFTFPDTRTCGSPTCSRRLRSSGRRSLHEIFALGRLRAGVTVETARRDLQTIARRLAQQYPESNTGYGASLEPLKGQMVDQARQALLAMLGAVCWCSVSRVPTSRTCSSSARRPARPRSRCEPRSARAVGA